jgi:hypothetical protein
MFDVNDIIRGYSIEQYSEAIVETLTQLLISKNLISSNEAKDYFKNNFEQILECIIERDKKEAKKRIEKLLGDDK